MKDISKVYKEWCGSDVHTNDCHPVHDSSETIEFAEKWAEVVKNIEHDVLLVGKSEQLTRYTNFLYENGYLKKQNALIEYFKTP